MEKTLSKTQKHSSLHLDGLHKGHTRHNGYKAGKTVKKKLAAHILETGQPTTGGDADMADTDMAGDADMAGGDAAHTAKQSCCGSSGRSYNSPIRQLQADSTRHRILDATDRLFAEHGYTRTKITDIASIAGVAPATVYATFKSKRGILTALIDRKLYTPAFYALHEAAHNAKDSREKMRRVTQLITMIYDTELPCRLEHLSGARAIDPDLWEFITERESQRRGYQEPLIAELHAAGSLRPEFSPELALDTLWALTARPLFALLRFERGWTPEQYAEWLYTLLESTLLVSQAVTIADGK